jgi:hypothetical protein
VRDEHIKDLLDREGLAGLGERELAAMRAHAEACGECARAFAAARVAASLLEARGAEGFEPSPFFQTRVLAAARERRAAGESWSFGRLWKAAGLMVSSMAASVAVLAALTFVTPQEATTAQITPADTYTAEDVIFGQGASVGTQVSDEQVLATLYGADEASEK